jgi:hypothetical protein
MVSDKYFKGGGVTWFVSWEFSMYSAYRLALWVTEAFTYL